MEEKEIKTKANKEVKEVKEVKGEEKKKEGKKKGKKLIPMIKIKDPQRAGIVAFVVMLVITAVLYGVVITFVVMNVLSPNDETAETSEEETKIETVVTQEESAIIDVVQKSKAAVVSIAITEMSFVPEQGVVDQSSNIGTGFIVDSNGIIVTNQHVVSDLDANYIVITSDGDEYDVIDIARDDSNDIAVLKVDATELTPLTLGNSEALVEGQTVIAIGTPLGTYAGSVTTGVVSGLDRDVTASTGWFGSSAKTYENVIQTDAAVNPGNSGGPLLNTSGEVIGINFATTSGADNISFALPVNIVSDRIEEYRTYGKFIKPYLGVSYQMISKYQARYYDNVVAGALVVRTDPYGPAQKAGIERGDIIIEFGGEKVENSLANMISEYKVGDEVKIKLWNDGEERTVNVTLVELD
ncbi:MAG: Trypsin-like serine protease with C-terminal PDZ domain [candidate division WS6 bacterium 34_10]|uniref:Trypsin-like serine protease with C-terminal PDZ domain n=1 Tax=candidate division WS6 bacterium 34_10 TaxID=1641389 RepID=A0A117M0C3_9BACT|nr:MAG: Trypsin-like serine protease with C-terminal PDZ domain [candidate division WS6 bacterium 34_10]